MAKITARFIILLLLGIAPTSAADYYFSDCGWTPGAAWQPTGDLCTQIVAGNFSGGTPICGQHCYGSLQNRICLDECTNMIPVPTCLPVSPAGGQITNPWCLDPESDGVNSLFAQIMDNGAGAVTSELAPGDTVYLCAGLCDGQGTATMYLQPSGLTVTIDGQPWNVLFRPRVNNVTVKNFPGETVYLSGDSSGDGIAQTGEVEILVDQKTNGSTGWTWEQTNIRRIGVKTAPGDIGIVFYLNNDPSDWIIQDNDIGCIGAKDWSCADVGPAPVSCDNQYNNYVFKVADLTGTLIMRRNNVHDVCGFAHRHTQNASATSLLVENSTYSNISQFSNDYGGANTTYRGNLISDTYDGMGIEENMSATVIEDNTFACLGVRRGRPNGGCGNALRVDNGNNGVTEPTTNDLTIRRNKFYSPHTGQYSATAPPGWWSGIITLDFNNPNANNNVLVENNMIWHYWPWQLNHGAIYVNLARASGTEVRIRDNTLFDSYGGIDLDGRAAVDYLVSNNLITYSNFNGTSSPGITEHANATGSHLTTNILANASQSSVHVDINGTTYTGSDFASLNNGTTRVGNAYGVACFQKTKTIGTCGVNETDILKWDLHLLAQGAAHDVGDGTTSAATDFDTQDRPAGEGYDVGADEWYGTGAPIEPPPAVTVRPTP